VTSSLQTSLRNALSGARRVAVLGVGSDLRGDDAAGIRVAAALERSLSGRKDVGVFLGHTAPENFSGIIRVFAPSHLVAVDAAGLGSIAGQAAILRGDDIGDTGLCTHGLPLSVMFAYLREALPSLEVVVIGIQPEDTGFGKPVSEAVSRASTRVARDLSAAIRSALGEARKPTIPE
jgi:hydrogenase 3 maturation protease